MERWIIDSIDEGTAVIEQKDGKVFHVPSLLLPQTAREGDVCSVAVDHDAKASAAVITIAIDTEATRAAFARSAAQLASTPKSNDPGGPITL